jgi:hypothetical protein
MENVTTPNKSNTTTD